ncbi:MAG: ATP synthase subunit I [Deltaproteobacteria bacterium]|nr:ATP synthase subunit I [Deltaproteobacteria bacterium]
MRFEKIPGIWFALSAVVYVIGLPLSFVWASWGFGLGFVAGGALVLLNAWASARKVKQADLAHKGSAMVSLMGGFYLRLIVVGLCLYGLVKFAKVDPVGLVIGLSVVPAGLFVMLALAIVANRRPKEV